MAGERTPDTSPPSYKGSSDDEISLREHLQRQLDAMRYATSERIDVEHQYVERVISDLHVLLDERYEAQKSEAARVAREGREELNKAERATEKRFDSVNEFRSQLNDQAHTFMPRTESISRHERTQEQLEKLEQHFLNDINAINRRLDTLQGTIQGARDTRLEGRQSMGSLYALIGAAVAVISAVVIIANFLGTHGG